MNDLPNTPHLLNAPEPFRLRSFLDILRAHDELEEIHDPVSLDDVTAILENSDKAVLMHQAGPEAYQLVGNVMGSRKRLGIAMGADPRLLAQEMRKRLAAPQETEIVPTGPVQQIIWRGADIDLRKLPFHLQHDEDGGVYISSALDFSIDPVTHHRNLGCRRLFLRGHNTLSTNLSQPSDLKRMYVAACERGETLPASFVIGVHPLDFLASFLRIPADEFALIARLRGETLRLVNGVSNGIPVPADAELVIEGYFDALGHRLTEGPYGEFWGLNGEMHINPLFHVTAITMRSDVLHHTVSHGGRQVSHMEASIVSQITGEALLLTILAAADIHPTAVYASPNVAVNQHVRIALKRGTADQGRQVINILHAAMGFRFVQVVDDDVDIFDDEQAEWAISTRFRADRDVIITPDKPGFHADVTRDENGLTAKIGLDCTTPSDAPDLLITRRPRLPDTARKNPIDLLTALSTGPKTFRELLTHSPHMDARDLAIELETLLQSGTVRRLEEGQWALPQ